MGSLATSEMIFFIATMVIAASVVGVLGGQTIHLTQSMGDSSKGVSSMIKTNFEIINNPSDIPNDNGYVFYVKNIGQEAMYFSNASVSTIINGTLISGSLINYVSPANSGELTPAQVGEIIVNVTLSVGYNTIQVVLSDGVSHSMTFQIS